MDAEAYLDADASRPPPAAADVLRAFGASAPMSRVQALLKKQLLDRLALLEAEARAQVLDSAAAKSAREAAGVELYGLQQHLARLSETLQASDDKALRSRNSRAARTEELERAQRVYAAKIVSIETDEARVGRLRLEADQASAAVANVEEYVKATSDNAALAKRAAIKGEEDLQKVELAKQQQDYALASLTAAVDRARTQSDLADSQFAAVHASRQEAVTMLTEAGDEMDAIRFESKALLGRWNSALVMIRRRDEALASAEGAEASNRQELEGMDAEEANLRKEVGVASSALAGLNDSVSHQLSELAKAQASQAQSAHQLEAAEARNVELCGMLASLREEAKRLVALGASLSKRTADAEAARVRAERERFATEDGIVSALANASSAETAERNVLKNAAALLNRVHSLELEAAEMEDAIAGAQLEASRRLAALAAQRRDLDSAEAVVAQREGAVAALEEELAERQSSIDRKMTSLDRLNRKCDALVASQPQAENMGPLHAEVANTQAALEGKRQEITALQRRWLADQTQLVGVTSECEGAGSQLRELTSRASLLAVKKTRLEQATEGQKGERRALEAAVAGMHGDVGRLNALLARNDEASATLKAGTVASERAFAETLKDLEQANEDGEAKVEALAAERDRLTSEILECERQSDLIAQKILLEEEAQEALDPAAGAAETAALEKALAAKKTRKAALTRQKELLIAEIERALEKREALAQRSRITTTTKSAPGTSPKESGAANNSSGSATATGGSGSKMTLRQRAASLRSELQAKAAALAEIDGAITAHTTAAENAAGTSAAHAERVAALQAEVGILQRELEAARAELGRAEDTAPLLSKMVTRLQHWNSGRLPSLSGDEVRSAQSKLADARQAGTALQSLAAELAVRGSDDDGALNSGGGELSSNLRLVQTLSHIPGDLDAAFSCGSSK